MVRFLYSETMATSDLLYVYLTVESEVNHVVSRKRNQDYRTEITINFVNKRTKNNPNFTVTLTLLFVRLVAVFYIDV